MSREFFHKTEIISAGPGYFRMIQYCNIVVMLSISSFWNRTSTMLFHYAFGGDASCPKHAVKSLFLSLVVVERGIFAEKYSSYTFP